MSLHNSLVYTSFGSFHIALVPTIIQVVRTVLQEERRDEGVPRPKARQVFNDLSSTFHPYHLSGIIFHCHCQGCKRLGDPRGAEVAVQVVFISRMLTFQFFGWTDVYDINNVDNADDVDDSDDDDNPNPGAWLPISSMWPPMSASSSLSTNQSWAYDDHYKLFMIIFAWSLWSSVLCV